METTESGQRRIDARISGCNNISEFAKQLIFVAKQTGEEITGTFKGVDLVVNSTLSVADIVKSYDIKAEEYKKSLKKQHDEADVRSRNTQLKSATEVEKKKSGGLIAALRNKFGI